MISITPTANNLSYILCKIIALRLNNGTCGKTHGTEDILPHLWMLFWHPGLFDCLWLVSAWILSHPYVRVVNDIVKSEDIVTFDRIKDSSTRSSRSFFLTYLRHHEWILDNVWKDHKIRALALLYELSLYKYALVHVLQGQLEIYESIHRNSQYTQELVISVLRSADLAWSYVYVCLYYIILRAYSKFDAEKAHSTKSGMNRSQIWIKNYEWNLIFHL